MEEAIVPAIYDPSQIDITIMVETEIAYEMTRQIAKQEGIFVGMSSGAAIVRSHRDSQTDRVWRYRDHLPGSRGEVPEHQSLLGVVGHLENLSYFAIALIVPPIATISSSRRWHLCSTNGLGQRPLRISASGPRPLAGHGGILVLSRAVETMNLVRFMHF